MRGFWARLAAAIGVLVAVIASASALAVPDPIKKDTTKCGNLKNFVCHTTCEDSVYTIGLCRDDRNGATSAISVQCCCCTEGANHRSFIGG